MILVINIQVRKEKCKNIIEEYAMENGMSGDIRIISINHLIALSCIDDTTNEENSFILANFQEICINTMYEKILSDGKLNLDFNKMIVIINSHTVTQSKRIMNRNEEHILDIFIEAIFNIKEKFDTYNKIKKKEIAFIFTD